MALLKTDATLDEKGYRKGTWTVTTMDIQLLRLCVNKCYEWVAFAVCVTTV